MVYDLEFTTPCWSATSSLLHLNQFFFFGGGLYAYAIIFVVDTQKFHPIVKYEHYQISSRARAFSLGGSKSDPANYRPVSLTSVIMKIFERIMRKAIVEHLDNNQLMNKSQHGFRKGRSCISALLEVYDNVMSSISNPNVNCIDMVYLDFAKAFNKVDHHILLYKLKQFGITKHVGIWLASFLSDRKQFVQIPGGISTYGPVSSGVLLGTVLGPVLFLILIADITKNVKFSNISSFADDTRLYLPIKSPTDIDNLKFDLRTVYDWAETNNMKFNSSEFNYVCYHTKNYPNNENIYIAPTHDIIKSVTTVRDLGVTMSNSCDFNAHIDKTVKVIEK